jgi:integrase
MFFTLELTATTFILYLFLILSSARFLPTILSGTGAKIQKCREKGGFPDWITSHVFRHTFASLFLDGVEK